MNIMIPIFERTDKECPVWKCPKCKFKRFQTKALAQQHIRRVHGGGA